MTDSRDTIYADPLREAGLFTFDDNVARVFPDMIKRSVPGYTTIVAMTGLLAQRYAAPGSNLYDLGCSLGASSLAMRQNLDHRDCRIIGVDNSKAMLERCRTIIETDTHDTPVDLVCADIENIAIDNASVVVLNFTLQFIPLAQRDAVIRHIYKGLRPGGVMVLSEKVTFEDPHLDELNIALHHEFKRANGYSELEIAQKRAAIENVLLPETLATHRERMANAGFSACDVWFQCFNFASMVALK
ncbi:carboxy-S-adenosyl-L-methionine synthase CmoA [Pseudohalioglobus sediminis]|uniref:Carboxy-S-adenosyl-L-methionine synthase n=1 Tax=Pseudohalioglobus sediminis TaxID=2606449 RepID=A0A5B0WRU9_9GAMM|nr:carboxy-S-adenosyl-L-methionine synthase CmoA [Pseudohalioglobus sediminis]KAA1189177.1 carboxy-S-adenosyl-L-methionine synthase CmoA [Pseudohalioglobus sediminis]